MGLIQDPRPTDRHWKRAFLLGIELKVKDLFQAGKSEEAERAFQDRVAEARAATDARRDELRSRMQEISGEIEEAEAETEEEDQAEKDASAQAGPSERVVGTPSSGNEDSNVAQIGAISLASSVSGVALLLILLRVAFKVVSF